MRDFRDAKAMARTLRVALAAKGLKITISESLELIAKAFGVADWNTLSAAVRAAAPARRNDASPSPPPTAERVLGPRPHFSRELELTLRRALADANHREHDHATLEHLLLALIEDLDASAVMKASNVDLGALKKNVANYVDNELRGLANSDGDDILLYGDEARTRPIAVLHTLRQQLTRREGRANIALADFVAPRASALADHVGAFMVTAGIGEDEVADRFKRANDDYSAIMVKSLADRLAEAFAERLHQRVRREFWGYAPEEALSNVELVGEKYRGIRPAPGYPAQPDHSEKASLFALLDGERRIGLKLTESFAMWPGASVCGLYFSHPESHYFGVGKIERDQVEDYAARKGWSVAEAEKWLAPVLNYDPLAAARTAAE